MALPLDPARLDWNLLRALGAVLAHGSLTRAAQRLGSSQPTLSRQIAELESRLGAPLFERAARRLVPTATARALEEPARRMLAAAQACADAADTAHQTLAGSVRLTASEVVSCHVLPPILAGLQQAHPEVQIELVASDRLDNLLEHEADIAVRMVQPTQAGLIARHIGDWPMGLYLQRDRAEQLCRALGVAVIGAELLPRLPKLGFDQSTQLIDGYRRAGLVLERADFGFRCDHQLAHLAALRAGLGLGVAMVPLASRLPELLRVLPEAPLPSLPVWLTASRALRGSRRLQLVFRQLAQALADWGGGGADAAPASAGGSGAGLGAGGPGARLSARRSRR